MNLTVPPASYHVLPWPPTVNSLPPTASCPRRKGEELWERSCGGWNGVCACVRVCVRACAGAGFLLLYSTALLLDWTRTRRALRLLARLRSSARMLTSAGVCRRMLTYADVCRVYSLVYTPPLTFEALLNFLLLLKVAVDG